MRLVRGVKFIRRHDTALDGNRHHYDVTDRYMGHDAAPAAGGEGSAVGAGGLRPGGCGAPAAGPETRRIAEVTV